jgi:CRP/FNR family transcriptional regulator, dissimilatory nitrate respiration regulator
MALNTKDMEVVRRASLFSGLSDDMLSRLLKDSQVAEYKRGEILFVRGEEAKFIYTILDGWVKIFRDTPGGEQTVIGILKPGEIVAEAAIFLGQAYPASTEIVDHARLLLIPAKPFLALVREDGDLALKMLGSMSSRLRALVLHIEQLQAHSTPQRLGGFLLDLCSSDETSSTIELPYDKSLIAARLGMKPESLSRALAKLRDLGVSAKGTTITISDVPKLRGFCTETPDSVTPPCAKPSK